MTRPPSTSSATPVAVERSGLATRTRWMSVASGSAALHNIALVALPLVDPVPNAALADADQDGMADLIDYAFGLHAEPDGSAHLPQGQLRSDN